MDKPEITPLHYQVLSKELVEAVYQSTPKDWIEPRKVRGGGTFAYIPNHFFTIRLNECFGFLWSFKVIDVFERQLTSTDSQVIARVQLIVTVPSQTKIIEHPDGKKETLITGGVEIVKEQCGGVLIQKYAKDGEGHKAGDIIDLADSYKSAITNAKKKCALELGLFIDIYTKGDMSNSLTDDQIAGFYKRGKDAGMSETEADSWLLEKFGKSLQECTPMEFSTQILPQLIKKSRETKK